MTKPYTHRPSKPGSDRPVLRWHGGKWLLAPWIIGHFPRHKVYVEPFGGAASVLMRKERSYAEVYNDLDGDVVNLFRVLRSEHAHELIAALRLTPFSREEFDLAYQPGADPMEAARRLVIRSFMGFGSNGHNVKAKTGFRANSNKSGTTPAHDWINYPDSLSNTIKRIEGVIVENRNAAEVMAQHDGPETLHYVDPPYVASTRSLKNPYDIKYRGGMYAHEMDDADHRTLLEALRGLTGMVVLSGYPHPIYDAALVGWKRIEKEALADGARPRIEVLWINLHCWQRLNAERAQLELLDGAA
jgi:DNA adenine methylase